MINPFARSISLRSREPCGYSPARRLAPVSGWIGMVSSSSERLSGELRALAVGLQRLVGEASNCSQGAGSGLSGFAFVCSSSV